MSRPTAPANAQPWFVRSDLRLAAVTGLSAGFGLLSDIPYGYYLPMTTAAVLSSSYGSSMKLGVQRLLGSLMGVILLLVFSSSLKLPLALGLGLALGTTRLLGGALGLQVGYKVAGNIIIMGWLVHSSEEVVWGPLRLFWTALGIVISLWAARWIWPSRTIPHLHHQFATLFEDLGAELTNYADDLCQEHPRRLSFADRRGRRDRLLNQFNGLRQQCQIARIELGASSDHHPLHRLWSELDLLASELISVLDGLRGLPAALQVPEGMRQLHAQEMALLESEVDLLSCLAKELRRPSLLERQTLPIGSLDAATTALQAEVELLRPILLKATLEARSSVSAQRLRQIVLRASLLGHMVMVTCDNSPGSTGFTPVLAQARAGKASAGSLGPR